MNKSTIAGFVALAVMPITSAGAAVVSYGGPLSHSCYEAAQASDTQFYNLDACNRSLRDEPMDVHDRAATYVNRGILLMASGRATDADADFDAALKLQSGLADGWLNKGFLRLREGHGRDALPLIQKALDIGTSRQPLAIFARGVAYEQMGSFSLAYADLRRAQDLDPSWSLPRQYLADYRIQSR